jgi:hypothetical protein
MAFHGGEQLMGAQLAAVLTFGLLVHLNIAPLEMEHLRVNVIELNLGLR